MMPTETIRAVDGYAKLQSFRLELWDDESACRNNMQPRRILEITREIKVKHRGELEVALTIMEEGTIQEYVFRAKSIADATKWYSALKKCIKEHGQWGHVTTGTTMQLAMPGNSKNCFLRSARQRSLYDQVPIFGRDFTTCFFKYLLTFVIFSCIQKIGQQVIREV